MIYRKSYMERLRSFKDTKLLKVITGLRRSGKSTLLQMYCDELLSEGVAPERILFINFELMKYDNIRDYRNFYPSISLKIHKNFLFW